DPQVQFLARGPGYSLVLGANSATMSLVQTTNPAPATDPITGAATDGAATTTAAQSATTVSTVQMQFVGANATPQVEGLSELPTKINYMLGNDSSQWHTDVPTYGSVRYHDLYPGVDLVYYGAGTGQNQLEYDFVVGAGVSPGVISLAFQGTSS